MSCRPEVAKGTAWRFCPDDRALTVRSLVLAHVVDEITERAPVSDIRIRSSRRDLRPRAGIDGILGLVGEPARIFVGPPMTVDVELTIEAEGYMPWRETLAVDATALPLQVAIELRRAGTRISGRVVASNGSSFAPLAGAVVSLLGYWPTFPPAVATVPAEPPHVISLVAGAYAPRAASAVVEQRTATLNAGQTKTLLSHAVRGADRVRVSDQVGIASGDVIALNDGHVDLAELIEIASVEGFTTPDQPATVFLAHKTANAHTVGTTAVPASLNPPTFAQNPLSRDVRPGDVCAFLASMTDLAAATLVEIKGGGPTAPEYHRVRHYTATTDPEGNYRLPPIARAALVQLNVTHPGIPTPPLQPLLSPGYHGADHRFDVISA